MLGSAMRRTCVKYSASPQADAATSTPASGGVIDWPIQPTATSTSTNAIDTKMSLKPVSSLKCSSSTAGAALRAATWSRRAAAAAGVMAPAATAASRSLSLYMPALLSFRTG